MENYSNQYLRYLNRDRENGFEIPNLSKALKDHIIVLETQIEILENNCISLFKERSEVFMHYEDHLPDFFMETRIRQGIIDGLQRRYPRGWTVDCVPRLFIDNDSLDNKFSIWTHFEQQFIMEEMPGLPIFTLNSIGEYLTLILALYKKDLKLIDLVLSRRLKQKFLLEENIYNIDRQLNLMLSFFLYRAYLNRLRLDNSLLINTFAVAKRENLNSVDLKNNIGNAWKKEEAIFMPVGVGYDQLGALLARIISCEFDE